MHIDWIKKEWISPSIIVTQFIGSIWKSCLFVFIRHLDRKKKRCLCSMEAKATGVVALPEQKPWKKYSLVCVHCSVNYSVDTRTSGSKSQHLIKSAELQTLWSGSWHSLAIQLEEWSLRYSSLPCRSDWESGGLISWPKELPVTWLGRTASSKIQEGFWGKLLCHWWLDPSRLESLTWPNPS